MQKFLKVINRILEPLSDHTKLSIGRLMLAVCFMLSSMTWWAGKDIPDTQLYVLITLLSYVLGTKAISSLKDIISGINETKQAINGVKNGKSNEDKEKPAG